MTQSPIEVRLHPPSPRHPCTLPPVSSLLSDVTVQHQQLQQQYSSSPSSSPSHTPTTSQRDLPSIPSLHLPDKVYPSLMLSIPYDPPSSSSSPTSSPFMSYQSLDTPQSSPASSPHPFLLPPPDTSSRSRSHSNASTSSWSSIATSLAVTAPSSPIHNPDRRLSDPSLMFDQQDLIYQQQQPDRHVFQHEEQQPYFQRNHSASPSLSPLQQPCPSASTSSSSTTDPIVKRKRGRPPNSNRQAQRDHWTFVTPTVWDVKRTQLPEHIQNQPSPSSSTPSPSETSLCGHPTASLSSSSRDGPTNMDSKNGVMLVLWPQDDNNGNGNGKDNETRDDINLNLNTFTSTRMDTTLTMPKKKRGRKPKTQLAGNSCFVWRDLTARRGANRAKSSTTTARTSPSPSPSPSPSLSPSPSSNANRSMSPAIGASLSSSTTTTLAAPSISSPTASPSTSNLLSVNTTTSRIIKKQPDSLRLHQHLHFQSNRKQHKTKNDDDDIIDWTKDLTLNDQSVA
ncbi:hypothetical protein BCR42DRAFT_406389 [Absidia repens]|uniref:Uncharacterized protein n=1 Tax=Absidia repens TaxID=90262 RepID=A0A1X2IUP2_9FUNG|nr:hypothetical protein BCR42DRAFT_406389 [Absidia repens]